MSIIYIIRFLILFRSIDRHLRDHGYKESLISSPEFAVSRQVLIAKRKELKSLGKGNRPNRARPLNPQEENRLWESGALADDSPDKL